MEEHAQAASDAAQELGFIQKGKEKMQKVEWGKLAKDIGWASLKYVRDVSVVVVGIIAYTALCTASEEATKTDNVVPINVKVAGL